MVHDFIFSPKEYNFTLLHSDNAIHFFFFFFKLFFFKYNYVLYMYYIYFLHSGNVSNRE